MRFSGGETSGAPATASALTRSCSEIGEDLRDVLAEVAARGVGVGGGLVDPACSWRAVGSRPLLTHQARGRPGGPKISPKSSIAVRIQSTSGCLCPGLWWPRWQVSQASAFQADRSSRLTTSSSLQRFLPAVSGVQRRRARGCRRRSRAGSRATSRLASRPPTESGVNSRPTEVDADGPAIDSRPASGMSAVVTMSPGLGGLGDPIVHGVKSPRDVDEADARLVRHPHIGRWLPPGPAGCSERPPGRSALTGRRRRTSRILMSPPAPSAGAPPARAGRTGWPASPGSRSGCTPRRPAAWAGLLACWTARQKSTVWRWNSESRSFRSSGSGAWSACGGVRIALSARPQELVGVRLGTPSAWRTDRLRSYMPLARMAPLRMSAGRPRAGQFVVTTQPPRSAPEEWPQR